jgi:hypothetical protein
MKTRLTFWALTLASLTSLQGAVFTFVNTTDGGYTFNYTGFVQNEKQVGTGDSFIVLDFAGLITGTGPSGAWSFSTLSDVEGQADDPTILDAVFTNTGATIEGQPGNTQLGTFSITSSITSQVQGSYVFVTTRVHGANTGDEFIGSGDIIVPGGTVPGGDTGVPEPFSLMLVGSGLLIMGWSRRCRRRGQIA